jgi:hypothetical protein
MSALTKAEVSPADTGTDVRPPIAHCYINIEITPPPWTSLCGQATAEVIKRRPDASKCVVCLDLLDTH